jgi:hypothetical protein
LRGSRRRADVGLRELQEGRLVVIAGRRREVRAVQDVEDVNDTDSNAGVAGCGKVGNGFMLLDRSRRAARKCSDPECAKV